MAIRKSMIARANKKLKRAPAKKAKKAPAFNKAGKPRGARAGLKGALDG